MTYVQEKDCDEIQDKIVSFLESNLIDPYEQATGKTRTNFVFGDDFKLAPIYPRIHVSPVNVEITRVTAGAKTTFLEELEHTFLIYYYNHIDHRYTFEDSTVLVNARQCKKYLSYIHTKLKAGLADFDGYFVKLRFGSIPPPVFNKNAGIWVSMLSITVNTLKR